MGALRRVARCVLAEAMEMGVAGLLLAGAMHAATVWAREGGRYAGPHSSTPTVLNALVVCAVDGLLLVGVSRSRRLARVFGVALLASIVCVPFLLPACLDWLSAIRVGGFGDFRWGLCPADFARVSIALSTVPEATIITFWTFVAVIIGRLALAALRRPRAGNRIALTALAATAGLLGLALHQSLTLPPSSQWVDAFPAVARVRVRDLPIDGGGAPLFLPSDVGLTRSAEASSDGLYSVSAVAPPLANGRGGTLPQQPLGLGCPLDETLVLRRGHRDGTIFLACGESPRGRWDDYGGIYAETSVIEVHYWEIKVYNFHLLGRVALPPAWLALAAITLAGSCALLRRSRPLRAGGATAHPYRAASPPVGAPMTDLRPLAFRVAAVVVSIHGAAPLVLAAWLRLLIASWP